MAPLLETNPRAALFSCRIEANMDTTLTIPLDEVKEEAGKSMHAP